MQRQTQALTKKIKDLEDKHAEGDPYNSSRLISLDELYKACMMRISFTISDPFNKDYLSDRQEITNLLDDKDMVNEVYRNLLGLHYNDSEKIKIVLSPLKQAIVMKLIAECDYKDLHKELIRVLIKPSTGKILNKFITNNDDLSVQYNKLIKLPCIQDLHNEFKDKKLTNKELSDAFNKALKIQDITTKDHICHFFHVCFKWIYEKLIGQYKSKSTLENKTERNTYQDTYQDTFQKFLNATNNKINNQR